MPIKGKHIAIAGGALVLVALVAGTVRAAGTASNLETKLLPKFGGFQLTGNLTVNVDAQITNPKDGTLTVSDPVLALYRHPVTKDSVPITTTDLTGTTVTIPPKSTIRLSDPNQIGQAIPVSVPTADIIQAIPEAIAALTGVGGPFVLAVHVTAKVKAPNLPRFSHTIKENVAITRPF